MTIFEKSLKFSETAVENLDALSSPPLSGRNHGALPPPIGLNDRGVNMRFSGFF